MRIFVVRKTTLVTVIAVLLAMMILIPVSMPVADPAASTEEGGLPIYSVETEEKKVAVTFNAAWDDKELDRVLHTLSEYNCRCTFFLVGTWAEKYPEAARKIRDAGHEIACHSYDHAHFSKLSEEEIRSDLEKSDTIIKEITGADCMLFRAPYGEYTPSLTRICRETGRYCIQWDADSLDWKGLSAAEMEERILSRLRNGSIILFHVGAENTASALPALLEKIRAEGYAFSTVGDLIYKENYTVNHEGRQVQTNREASASPTFHVLKSALSQDCSRNLPPWDKKRESKGTSVYF